MTTERNWAKVIDYLYDNQTGLVMAPRYHGGDSSELDPEHEFVQELELDSKEASDALFQAIEFGFLEMKAANREKIGPNELEFDMLREHYRGRERPLREYTLGLSEKGFNIAHERDLRKREENYKSFQKLNGLTVMLFTVILATSVLTQTVLSFPEATQLAQLVTAAIIGFMIITVIALVAWYRRMS